MTNDAEKRFDQPGAFRAATKYTVSVVVVAAIAFAVYALTAKHSMVIASVVPAVLFIGGIGAFVQTYRLWKAEGGWVAWQGAGWFLLTLMLFCLSIPLAAASSTWGA
jgi:hypothetical protein